MRSASAELLALLNSATQFIVADLYTVTLFGGAVYRWTSFDIPITLGADTYACSPDAPILSRSRTRTAIGLEVDTLTVTLGIGLNGFEIGGIPLPQAARNGLFDEARVEVRRVFMLTPGDTSVGALLWFGGNVSEVQAPSTAVVLTVKSDLEKLSRQMPRNLFMPGCSHILFDTGCGLTRASFEVTGEVTAAPTTTGFESDVVAADDFYRLGVLLFTSGVHTGRRVAVKEFTAAGGVFDLTLALPEPPAIGDTFQVVPGCDKTQGTCETKFSNLTRFRGFPYVPSPENAR